MHGTSVLYTVDFDNKLIFGNECIPCSHKCCCCFNFFFLSKVKDKSHEISFNRLHIKSFTQGLTNLNSNHFLFYLIHHQSYKMQLLKSMGFLNSLHSLKYSDILAINIQKSIRFPKFKEYIEKFNCYLVIFNWIQKSYALEGYK